MDNCRVHWKQFINTKMSLISQIPAKRNFTDFHAGAENAGVENTGTITYGKPLKQKKTLRYIGPAGYLLSSARGCSRVVARWRWCQSVRSTRKVPAGLPWRWRSTTRRWCPAPATCARRADWRTDGIEPCGSRTGASRRYRDAAAGRCPPTAA